MTDTSTFKLKIVAICAHPTVSPSHHFVDTFDHRWWRRARVETIERRGWQERIVRCSAPGCDSPATQLDHQYPYDAYFCRCDEHRGAKIDGESRPQSTPESCGGPSCGEGEP